MYKMESYSLKCRKYTKNINPQVSCTGNGKIKMLSRLLSKLGIKLGDSLF